MPLGWRVRSSRKGWKGLKNWDLKTKRIDPKWVWFYFVQKLAHLLGIRILANFPKRAKADDLRASTQRSMQFEGRKTEVKGCFCLVFELICFFNFIIMIILRQSDFFSGILFKRNLSKLQQLRSKAGKVRSEKRTQYKLDLKLLRKTQNSK